MQKRLADKTRRELGLGSTQQTDVMKLADLVGADVRRADELTDLSKLEELEEIQPGAFSACTFHIRGKPVVVYTPLASHGRMQSDIAHEIAHILLEHEIQSVHQLDGISFFTCDPDEETRGKLGRRLSLAPEKAAVSGRKTRAIGDRCSDRIRCEPINGRVQDPCNRRPAAT